MKLFERSRIEEEDPRPYRWPRPSSPLAEHVRAIEMVVERVMRRQSGILALLRDLVDGLARIEKKFGSHDRWERKREEER